jgi:hypothetical protein
MTPAPSSGPRLGGGAVETHGSEERVAWVRSQPCWICSQKPSENSHVKSGGMGRKADARHIVPLCHKHHDEHHHGHKTFQNKYGVDLEFAAQITDARWEVYKNQLVLPLAGEAV